jgi:hypothetical protein
MVWAPLQYRAPFCVGTMGAGHFGQFEFMEVTEGKPYNRASSVGRFIGRSFCVQAKDKLRPTWRPSAGSPQQKCTPSAAFGGVSPLESMSLDSQSPIGSLRIQFLCHPGGGDFSGAILCGTYETGR